MKIVIVGLSAAGLSALETINRQPVSTEVTIITEEPFEPYSRCLLTNYLGKEVPHEKLFISHSSKFRNRINFVFGETASKIIKDQKFVVTSSGKTYPYDKLLLCVGADPIKPDYAAKSDRVFTLRYLKDAQNIEKKLTTSATVVGGGFVGIKCGYSLVEDGKKVNLVVSSGYPLSVILDEETGEIIEKELKNLGINVLTCSDIADIQSDSKSITVFTTTNHVLKSDVVIVGKGVTPRLKLAKTASIAVNKGIIVNQFLETTEKDIFAAGDCVETLDVVRKESFINAIWPNAVEQGYYAAMNMLGFNLCYPGSIGYNSLKTKSFHLITAGILKGDNIKIYKHYQPHKNQLRKIAVKDDVVVGMAFLNNSDEAGAMVNLIKSGKHLSCNPRDIVSGKVSFLKLFYERSQK